MRIKVVIVRKAMDVGRSPKDEIMRSEVTAYDIDVPFWCVNY